MLPLLMLRLQKPPQPRKRLTKRLLSLLLLSRLLKKLPLMPQLPTH